MSEDQENPEAAESPENDDENTEVGAQSPEKDDENPETIDEIDESLKKLLEKLGDTFDDTGACHPFLLTDYPIRPETVDKVFDELQEIPDTCLKEGRLVVVVDSGGGDIDAAYNLAMLFRSYGHEQLTFVVPRWAKSAATLLVCGGDSVMMTPVAELGPLDPQITQISPLEQRVEKFSPLHIESTLEMIRNEFQQGNTELATGLLQRLQFPITLGSFKKSLDICKQYATKLLASRMLKEKGKLAEEIANKLVEDYADHGFCINIDEAKSLGLVACSPSPQQQRQIWKIHKLVRRKSELQEKQKESEMRERLKGLPPGLQTGSLSDK